MRLNCNINGSPYSLVVNSDKPLNQILKENLITFADNSRCLGASCGNCIVLINGTATLSCLVPAFRLNGTTILTFEGFEKTRFCHDIERAYDEAGNSPCPQCYAAKTMLIESILTKVDKENQVKTGTFTLGQNMKPQSSTNEQAARNRSGSGGISQELIAQEMAVSKCQCMELSELEKIINLAYKYRSKRRARRS